MKFKFTGDNKGDNPQSTVMVSRVTGKHYAFSLDGAGVEVDSEDVEMFKNHSHFAEVRDSKKKTKKKKVSKKAK